MKPEPIELPSAPDTELHRMVHLVLKPDWPVALCGVNVSDLFGTAAAGMDRCPACLKIARVRGLGRPGWEKG